MPNPARAAQRTPLSETRRRRRAASTPPVLAASRQPSNRRASDPVPLRRGSRTPLSTFPVPQQNSPKPPARLQRITSIRCRSCCRVLIERSLALVPHSLHFALQVRCRQSCCRPHLSRVTSSTAVQTRHVQRWRDQQLCIVTPRTWTAFASAARTSQR